MNLRYISSLLCVLITVSCFSEKAAAQEPEVMVRCHTYGMSYWEDQGAEHGATLRMARCLAALPSLGVSWTVANRIATCESGWYDHAVSWAGYKGIYQEGDKEFATFWQPGPRWVHYEFRQNHWRRPAAVFDARANIIAAYVHASRYGWGAWVCQ